MGYSVFKLTADWCFLDVKDGRYEIQKLLNTGADVTVSLKGKLRGQNSGDDGVSIEFEVELEELEVEYVEPSSSDTGTK